MKKKYTHLETIHSLSDPKEIVPEIIKLLNPKSVVDIGCGIGTFLYCFKEAGINDVLGIDGSWVNKELLSKYLSVGEFQECDLERPLILKKKFDLAISLEVGEHLSEKSADIFVQNLISAGTFILFWAAIPLQGGQNHVNEQWLTYWDEKFLKYNYVIQDVLRPIFWDNSKIFYWYRQNMVLITPKEFRFNPNIVYNPLRNVVHYELFTSKVKTLQAQLEAINRGELSKTKYLSYLVRSLIGYNNYKNIKHKLKKKE